MILFLFGYQSFAQHIALPEYNDVFTPEHIDYQIVKLRGTVLFSSGSYDLSDSDRYWLCLSFDDAKHYPVIVAGFADTVGNEEANQKLSEKRTAAVKDYLVAMGWEDELIRTYSYGMHFPFTDDTSRYGIKLNRRVEVFTYLPCYWEDYSRYFQVKKKAPDSVGNVAARFYRQGPNFFNINGVKYYYQSRSDFRIPDYVFAVIKEPDGSFRYRDVRVNEIRDPVTDSVTFEVKCYSQVHGRPTPIMYPKQCLNPVDFEDCYAPQKPAANFQGIIVRSPVDTHRFYYPLARSSDTTAYIYEVRDPGFSIFHHLDYNIKSKYYLASARIVQLDTKSCSDAKFSIYMPSDQKAAERCDTVYWMNPSTGRWEADSIFVKDTVTGYLLKKCVLAKDTAIEAAHFINFFVTFKKNDKNFYGLGNIKKIPPYTTRVKVRGLNNGKLYAIADGQVFAAKRTGRRTWLVPSFNDMTLMGEGRRKKVKYTFSIPISSVKFSSLFKRYIIRKNQEVKLKVKKPPFKFDRMQ